MMFQEQAERCRRQAAQYVGRPEAPFLLSVARAFDDLATRANPSVFVQLKERGAIGREQIPA
jgi:hypothetical protein